jgi:hypothetical protein
VDERLNENRYPLHSVLREIQETDCGDLADLTPLVAVAGQLKFQGWAQRQGPLRVQKLRFTPTNRHGSAQLKGLVGARSERTAVLGSLRPGPPATLKRRSAAKLTIAGSHGTTTRSNAGMQRSDVVDYQRSIGRDERVTSLATSQQTTAKQSNPEQSVDRHETYVSAGQGGRRTHDVAFAWTVLADGPGSMQTRIERRK